MVSVLAALLAVGIALLPCQLTLQPQHRVMSASELVGRLSSGQGVNEVGIVVEGELDLRPLGTVARPFRCRGCTFSGTIEATDVVFQGIVDLSGATLKGALLLAGARLDAPFLFDSTYDHRSEIHGRMDLRLVKFSDFASLDGARLLGPINFTSAQFLRGVSFVETEFFAEAFFDRVQFGSMASFAGASTEGLRMERATFSGPAIFRQHTFHADADFTGATFQQQANFTLAEFEGKALFDSASFEQGASFRLMSALSASFRSAQARGPLIFDGAVFVNGASLAGLSVLDLLSLQSMHIPTAKLELDELSASTLLLDVSTVDQVRGVSVQQKVLSQVEKSAEATGDLSLANDARFHRLTLQASHSGPAYQVFDRIVLREIGGYLVRPIHPLRAIVFVLALGVMVRAIPTWWRNTRLSLLSVARRSTTCAPRLASTGGSNTRAFVRGLWVSAHQVVAKQPGIEWQDDEVPSGRAVAVWSEFLAHKILIVLFLLSLGNSNPTVRQIIDSVVRG
jgi:uncharacterized protein YjbI with pentapeptide repeats